MKNYCILLILLFLSVSVSAQRIEFDIFDDLKYSSKDRSYSAYLKKDIFDNLIFTDNRENKITFEKKYLEREHPDLSEKKEARTGFFRQLIHQYDHEKGYKATFSVDILDKIIIKDNRNNEIEMGTDIFGNPTYEEKRGGIEISVRKSLNGDWVFRSGRDQASLGKDIFDRWMYSDSVGNKFEFSESTWRKLIKRHKSEDNIFRFLVREFLLY